MKRSLWFLLATALACADLDSGSTEPESTTTDGDTCVDRSASPADVRALEAEFLEGLDAYWDEYLEAGREPPRFCTAQACADCKVSLIPPGATCWLSTPKHGCSGGCSLVVGCGGSCW